MRTRVNQSLVWYGLHSNTPHGVEKMSFDIFFPIVHLLFIHTHSYMLCQSKCKCKLLIKKYKNKVIYLERYTNFSRDSDNQSCISSQIKKKTFHIKNIVNNKNKYNYWVWHVLFCLIFFFLIITHKLRKYSYIIPFIKRNIL